jgi:DUF2950 family protein
MESFTKTATADMETEIMRDRTIRFEEMPGRGFAAKVAFAIFALLLAGYAQAGLAQPPGKKTFSSPEEASHALYLAIRDDNEEAMTEILGAGKELVSLDDTVQDKLDRERFTRKYQEMHRLVQEPDATTVLYIGAENWPFPIPLVSSDGEWYFDAKAGMEEVLFRRIGENELAAIQACHALVVAEEEHKGLEEHPSTQAIRALLVNAGTDGPVVPFHGYYFRILANQGKSAATGARSRIDRKTPGSRFAFVAYPAKYRSTGVVTYVVSDDDVVYEKDLGPTTVQVAKRMSGYKPDSTWHPAE